MDSIPADLPPRPELTDGEIYEAAVNVLKYTGFDCKKFGVDFDVAVRELVQMEKRLHGFKRAQSFSVEEKENIFDLTSHPEHDPVLSAFAEALNGALGGKVASWVESNGLNPALEINRKIAFTDIYGCTGVGYIVETDRILGDYLVMTDDLRCPDCRLEVSPFDPQNGSVIRRVHMENVNQVLEMLTVD